MSRPEALEQIRSDGYITVPFELSAADRRAFTKAGNRIISLAEEDPKVVDLLTCNLLPSQQGQVRGAYYSVSGPRNSGDEKIWMHVGYQSRANANAQTPERNQPSELRDFWPQVEEMLEATELATLRGYAALDEMRLRELTYPVEIAQRNVILRIVRYLGARALPPMTEAVSGHIDLGVVSLHLGESHGNWFRSVAVPPELIGDSDTSERRAAYAELRQRMKVIRFAHEDEAAMFLDATYTKLDAFFDDKRGEFLPLSYHAGIRPPEKLEAVYESEDQDAEDRLALLAFVGPSLPVMNDPRFVSPTVRECRPVYEEAA